MEINFSVLGTYFAKNGYAANVSIDLDHPSLLIFKPGHDGNTGLTVMLEFSDVNAIMELNDVYNRITTIRDGYESRRFSGERPDIDKEIEDAIYDTLSKYVIEMLNASMARRFFPEIRPLPKHITTYFKS